MWFYLVQACETGMLISSNHRSHAQELKDLMIEKYFKPLKSEQESGEAVEIPTPLPWYVFIFCETRCFMTGFDVLVMRIGTLMSWHGPPHLEQLCGNRRCGKICISSLLLRRKL